MYNVSALPAYVEQKGTALIAKAVLGSQTIVLLTQYGAFDPLAKGSEAVNLLDTDIVIQADDGCGRSPLGGATLAQAILYVRPLKVDQNYCDKDLLPTWVVSEMKAKMAGLDYTEMMFADEIGNLNSKKVADKLEKMIWQGNTAVSDVSLSKINGFIIQIKNSTTGYVNAKLPATATANVPADDGKTITRLRYVANALPIEVREESDYMVLIGRDTEDAYKAEIADRNLFGASTPGEIFGTSVKYMVVNGLNGTKVIWAGKVGALRAGGEMTAAKFEARYSMETKMIYMDSKFSLGVVPIYTSQMALADYSTPAV